MSVTTTSTSVGRAAELYNWAVASYAISASWESGILDHLEANGHLDVDAFAAAHGFDADMTVAVLRCLEVASVVELDAKQRTAVPSGAFAEVYETKALFYWLHRGCGELFTKLAETLPTDGWHLDRDAKAVGIASREANAAYFDPVFKDIIEGVEFQCLADLGCGAGQRLIDMAITRPGTHGLGLEIAPGAVELAQQQVSEAGLDGRIEVLRRDVARLEPEQAFERVDLLTCFLMGHDFWPRENAVDTFAALRAAFPHVRSFILCDTVRHEGPYSADGSIFVSGYEAAHSAMRKYIPSVDEWLDLFEETGWECKERYSFDVPSCTVMFHLESAPQ